MVDVQMSTWRLDNGRGNLFLQVPPKALSRTNFTYAQRTATRNIDGQAALAPQLSGGAWGMHDIK